MKERIWNKKSVVTGIWATICGACGTKAVCRRKSCAPNCSAVAATSRSCYAKYEAGELNIRASVLIELRKIYGCSYDEFFVGLDD